MWYIIKSKRQRSPEGLIEDDNLYFKNKQPKVKGAAKNFMLKYHLGLSKLMTNDKSDQGATSRFRDMNLPSRRTLHNRRWRNQALVEFVQEKEFRLQVRSSVPLKSLEIRSVVYLQVNVQWFGYTFIMVQIGDRFMWKHNFFVDIFRNFVNNGNTDNLTLALIVW